MNILGMRRCFIYTKQLVLIFKLQPFSSFVVIDPTIIRTETTPHPSEGLNISVLLEILLLVTKI